MVKKDPTHFSRMVSYVEKLLRYFLSKLIVLKKTPNFYY